MGRSSMQRGAQEANDESRQLAAAKELGAAFGNIAFAVLEVQKLSARVEALEATLRAHGIPLRKELQGQEGK